MDDGDCDEFLFPYVSRYSVQGRAGRTGAAATMWMSETSVLCTVGGGAQRSLVLSVTVGDVAGSVSRLVSYDVSVASSVGRSNVGSSGSVVLTLGGADVGTSRCVIWDGVEGMWM